MEQVRLWFSVIIPTVNLMAIIIAGIKILNRQTREFEQREGRMVDAEKAIMQLHCGLRDLQKESNQLSSLSVRVEELCSEMKRMRDRLDRWLDVRAQPGEYRER